MQRKRIFAWLIIAAFAGDGWAETPKIYVSTTPISIPAPKGFFRYDGKSAFVDKFQKDAVAPANRLLAAFGADSDVAEVMLDTLPSLKRHFNALVPIVSEKNKFTKKDFQSIKNEIRVQFESELDHAKVKEIEQNLAVAGEALHAQAKIGERVFLGAFDETDESICFAMLANPEITLKSSSGVTTQKGVIVASSCMVLVAGHVITLNCVSDYKNKTDIVWVKDTMKTWRDEILKVNNSQ